MIAGSIDRTRLIAMRASPSPEASRDRGFSPDPRAGPPQPNYDQLEHWSLVGGVLITIHRLSQGGADRVMVLLANGFSKAGIPTAVVVLRSGGEAEIELLNMLHPDIAVSHAGRPMGLRHLELIRGARYISRQIERAKPQVLFASSSNMGLVTGITRTRQRVRPIRIMKLTNPVFRPRDGTIAKRLYRRLLYGFIFARYRKILMLSDAEQRALSATYPGQCGRFETVPNPYVAPAMIPAPANGTYPLFPSC